VQAAVVAALANGCECDHGDEPCVCDDEILVMADEVVAAEFAKTLTPAQPLRLKALPAQIRC